MGKQGGEADERDVEAADAAGSAATESLPSGTALEPPQPLPPPTLLDSVSPPRLPQYSRLELRQRMDDDESTVHCWEAIPPQSISVRAASYLRVRVALCMHHASYLRACVYPRARGKRARARVVHGRWLVGGHGLSWRRLVACRMAARPHRSPARCSSLSSCSAAPPLPSTWRAGSTHLSTRFAGARRRALTRRSSSISSCPPTTDNSTSCCTSVRAPLAPLVLPPLYPPLLSTPLYLLRTTHYVLLTTDYLLPSPSPSTPLDARPRAPAPHPFAPVCPRARPRQCALCAASHPPATRRACACLVPPCLVPPRPRPQPRSRLASCARRRSCSRASGQAPTPSATLASSYSPRSSKGHTTCSGPSTGAAPALSSARPSASDSSVGRGV